jgi:hypothetical protein
MAEVNEEGSFFRRLLIQTMKGKQNLDFKRLGIGHCTKRKYVAK